MNPHLDPFVTMLNNRGLITLNVAVNTEEGFENRFKLQKYVFLAKYFGLDMGYNYSMYLYGPYSPDLAEDYYALANGYSHEGTGFKLPNDFDESRFMDLVKGRSYEWLEIAATLLALHRSVRQDSRTLFRMALNMKGHRFSGEMIHSVLRELEGKRLLRFSD